MPESPEVLYAVEGQTDVPFVEKLIAAAGGVPRLVLVAGGKSRLDPRIRRWNQPSNRQTLFVARDWDANDGADCPAMLRSCLLGGDRVAPLLELRIVVRAMESWILADAVACASFFAIKVPPTPPDMLSDPKAALVQACSASRRPGIRTAMAPTATSGRRVGPDYEAQVITFGREHWDVERASARSPGLERALRRARELVARS